MNLNALINESSELRTMEMEANRLASKWEKSGLLEGISDKREKGNMAMILESQAKRLLAEANVTGTGASFTSGQGEQWAGVALPLVRKVFAQISSKEYVSVQPMKLPSGLVFYLDFKYGTTRKPFTDGDNIYGNVSTAGNLMGVDSEVSGGLYGAGRFGYSRNLFTSSYQVTTGSAASSSIGYKAQLLPSNFRTVTVSLSGTSFDSTAVRAFRLLSGSVDVTGYPEFTTVSGNNVTFVVTASAVSDSAAITGSVTYLKATADNARGDFEASAGTSVDTSIVIPEVDIQLSSTAITAETRKLKAKWTPEFAQDLGAYQNIDAEAEITSILSEYISMEIDLEVIDMLIQNAATTERWSVKNNTYWDGTSFVSNTSDFYNTQGGWFQTLGTKIQKVSANILQKTLRGGANFLVVSPIVSTILESIPGYAADTDGDKDNYAFGAQKIGQLNGRFKVWKNPYMKEDVILMGYKGGSFLETGAVYSPYVPLMMTPLVYDPETFTPSKGLMTRYAKKMIRNEYFGKLYVSNTNLI